MNAQIVRGSLSDIAKKNNQSLAESFLNAEIVILLDNSGSMEINDAPNGMSRQEAAERELKTIQGNFQGKVALVCFADYPVFSPNGKVVSCGGMTDMTAALHKIKVADDCGLKIVLISDGAPDSESSTLQVASTFKSRIDCIYIGREEGSGQAFLDKLMKVTGGKRFESNAPGMLGDGVSRLLLEG